MSYYSDERITYDTAEGEVEKFVTAHGETRHLITAKDVCRHQDIPLTTHNRQRVLEALEAKFSVAEEWSSTTKKYKIEV